MPGKLIVICTDESRRLSFSLDSSGFEIMGTTNRPRAAMVRQSRLFTEAASGNVRLRSTLEYLTGRSLAEQKLMQGELDG
jgi:hypothetical protein